MVRLFLTAVALLLCLAFERGFIGSLPGYWALLPICAAIGVFSIVHMRPFLGLTWLAATGIALDIHYGFGMGQVVILSLLGMGLLFVVGQYVTHRSYYALTILSLIFFLIWGALNAAVVLARAGAPALNILAKDTLALALLGVLSVIIVAAVTNGWRRYVAPYIRVRL